MSSENTTTPKSNKIISTEDKTPIKEEKEENIFNEIKDIDEYVKNIPSKDLIKTIEKLKDIKDNKLDELNYEENILNEYEKIENKNNDSFSKTENLKKEKNLSKKINLHKNKNDNMSQSVEYTILYREHEKNLNELKEEYKNKLNKEIESIENNFQKERSEIIENHRIKVKNFEEEIFKYKIELNNYEVENNKNIIKREEYELMLNKIYDKYKEKYNINKKEIEKLENKIEKENSKLLNNDKAPYKFEINNETLQENNLSNEIEDLMKELNEKKEKNNQIFLLSKLKLKIKERPSQSSNYIIKTDGSEYDYDTDEIDELSIRDIPSLNFQPVKKIHFFRTHQDIN